jgi:hypothetical protein
VRTRLVKCVNVPAIEECVVSAAKRLNDLVAVTAMPTTLTMQPSREDQSWPVPAHRDTKFVGLPVVLQQQSHDRQFASP